MVVFRHLFVILVLLLSLPAYAWEPLAVEDDPLVRMPGTQPGDGVTLEAPNRCLNCHAGFDEGVEPGFMWKGSMMGQAARDPIFWATMTVAMQDSVWALGNPNATDLCERCHFPQGWLEGRSDPTNASLMQGSDYDGIHCDFCHTAYDPFFADTYDGTREGSDWNDYWDEASNTGPGSGTLAQNEADATRAADASEAAELTQHDGQPLFAGDQPANANYDEAASGQFFISGGADKRASFADAGAKHKMLYSRFHKSRFYCGTCHDVSNPVLANLGAGRVLVTLGRDGVILPKMELEVFHVTVLRDGEVREQRIGRIRISKIGRTDAVARVLDGGKSLGTGDIAYFAGE